VQMVQMPWLRAHYAEACEDAVRNVRHLCNYGDVCGDRAATGPWLTPTDVCPSS
jgi:hypothetical protein